MVGVYFFKQNWIAAKGNLKLAILYHYTGVRAAQDTIQAHGGNIDNVPFVQCILGVENTPEEEPSKWVRQKYQHL
jgi:hypothetical protein